MHHNFLRLRSIMIGRHFYANMKVQTAVCNCEDNNNSKSRAATYVKLAIDIYIYNDIGTLYSM